MGIFSSRKKTYVSSVVYNLAGPVEDRPDYLKSVVLGNLLTKKNFRMAQTIQNAYVGGTGMRLRGYHRWARENYKQIGISRDSFLGKPDFNSKLVRDAMLADFEINAYIDWIDSSNGSDIEMWGLQWMRENMPDKAGLDVWTVDYVDLTQNALINFTDDTPPVYFEPEGFRERIGQWLYVSYSRPLTVNRWTTPQLFIYRRGTGSAALDALFLTASSTGEYLPYIPIRHENKFLSESYKPVVFEEAKKAYKKATGAKLTELIDKVADNESLDEIDFAYIFFGVSLNNKDNSSLKYVFEYFKHLGGNQIVGASTVNNWVSSQSGLDADIADWNSWQIQQREVDAGSDLTGPAPSRPSTTGAPGNSVIIQDNGPGQTNLKIELKWNSISIVQQMGLGKADAKVGDVWFTFGGSQTINVRSYSEEEIEDLKIDTVEMYHQVSALYYQKIILRGMTHINHIYNGKSVEITAAQALLDADESGFIVPIHYGVFREMSLIDATQMASQCMNIVFNSYQIVKKKWYQRGIFVVILVIAVIIITVVTGGAAGPAGIGLLGSAAGVGAALGFTGIAALIAGSVANMIAAMILTQLITYASVEILGEKIGYIVAAIASIAALQFGTALQSGQSMASVWGSLMQPMNLLHLTSSVGDAYGKVLGANAQGYMVKAQEAAEEYRQQSLELQGQYAENFGYGTALFDPMSLTGIEDTFFTESSETFLSRTLLTGSDIAQMSKDMITNFVELTLNNEFEEA